MDTFCLDCPSDDEAPEDGVDAGGYGSAGNGSASHLATLLLANTAGLDMVHVPYKGAGPAITDLVGNGLLQDYRAILLELDWAPGKPVALSLAAAEALGVGEGASVRVVAV